MYRSSVDESYYARDNTPSFYQFKDKYHFYDDYGRLYMIATKNRQVFENTRFKNTRRSTDSLEPVVNNYGLIKLYVKLSSPQTPWFVRNDMNKPLVLHERRGRNRSHIVELKTQTKVEHTRRTGSVQVKGLDKLTLIQLLTQ